MTGLEGRRLGGWSAGVLAGEFTTNEAAETPALHGP